MKYKIKKLLEILEEQKVQILLRIYRTECALHEDVQEFEGCVNKQQELKTLLSELNGMSDEEAELSLYAIQVAK